LNLIIMQIILWCWVYFTLLSIMELLTTQSNIQTKNIIANHFPQFYKKYQTLVRPRVIQSIHKISVCWNWKLGYKIYTCNHCAKTKYINFTCKSKLCNTCSKPASHNWINNLISRLPTNLHYYHITFKIPEQLREIFLRYRHLGILQLLFLSASQTLTNFFRS
jgi:hypothetical protein